MDTDTEPRQPASFAQHDRPKSPVTIGRTELLQGRSWWRGEAFVAARPIAARFFVGVVFVIALARRRGIVVRTVLRWLGRYVFGCFLLFDPVSVSNGLGASVLFAAQGATVFQIGPGPLPSSGGIPAIVTAVPVQGMAGGEIAVTPLEKTLSPGKTRPSGLPAAVRTRILKLGQGERKLPAGQVSPLEL